MEGNSMSEAIAHHEAGHAVIARALWLKVDWVTITQDLDDAGSCYSEYAMYLAEYADDATRLSAIEKDIIVALAGPIAECQYRSLDFNVMREEELWDSDLKMVKYLLNMAMELLLPKDLRPELYGELFDRLSIDTEILVSSHWSSIECVADALLEFSDLNQWHVDELIAGHVFHLPELS
jgi:hypothetical protein